MMSGLEPLCTQILADLKTGSRLGCMDQDEGTLLALAPCQFLAFGQE